MTYEEWGKRDILRDFGILDEMFSDWTIDRDALQANNASLRSEIA
jgi:hypothetical protein